jgi:hypothetical protein
MNFETVKESELHNYFHQKLIEDFYMIHEVEGACNINHPAIDNPRVIADYLLYPRQHLLNIGFADTWFAVEIKTLKTRWGAALQQAFWYTVSSFRVRDRLIVPGFSLAWRPVPSRKGYGHIGEGGSVTQGEIISFGHLNTGVIQLYEKEYYECEILFGCERYARKYNDRATNEIAYHVHEGRKGFYLKPGNGQGISSHTGVNGVSA